MKNGIIIDGKQYELQKVDQELIGDCCVCEVCDLEGICDALGEGNQKALCVILHSAGWNCNYKYIGDIEDDKNR